MLVAATTGEYPLSELSNVFWLDRRPDGSYGSVQGNLRFDVVIVGAGIVGLHTALGLRGTGLRVAVLEARRIGCQATGRSTAKVTSQHGLKYGNLVRDFGRDMARLYADANEQAKRDIAALSESIQDNAHLEARSAFIYAEDERQADSLREEADAAASLGLPAQYLEHIELPLPCAGALRFADQFQFDPYLYLRGVARITAADLAVFEGSRVGDIVGDGPFHLQLERGVITTDKVVVCTHMPIVGDGMYFSKAFPFAHPVAAAPLSSDSMVDGMFINAEGPSRSFRTAQRGGHTFLVAAGKEFKTGDAAAAEEAVADLLDFLDHYFQVPEASHLWINEDFRSMDGVPFIGPASPTRPDLLITTGFDAWGITQGAVAGEILAGHILGNTHPAAALFEASRLKPVVGGKTFIVENLKTAAHLAEERLLKSRVVSINDIGPGEAGVIDEGGEQLAVRRTNDGRIIARSAICTHLGCVVGWNAVDRTWDCSCHGSRFDEDGAVLSGPAAKPLEQRPLPSGVTGT